MVLRVEFGGRYGRSLDAIGCAACQLTAEHREPAGNGSFADAVCLDNDGFSGRRLPGAIGNMPPTETETGPSATFPGRQRPGRSTPAAFAVHRATNKA